MSLFPFSLYSNSLCPLTYVTWQQMVQLSSPFLKTLWWIRAMRRNFHVLLMVSLSEGSFCFMIFALLLESGKKTKKVSRELTSHEVKALHKKWLQVEILDSFQSEDLSMLIRQSFMHKKTWKMFASNENSEIKFTKKSSNKSFKALVFSPTLIIIFFVLLRVSKIGSFFWLPLQHIFFPGLISVMGKMWNIHK